MIGHCIALLRRLFRARSAITSIEYGLIASMIAVTILSSVNLEVVRLVSVFTTIAAHL